MQGWVLLLILGVVLQFLPKAPPPPDSGREGSLVVEMDPPRLQPPEPELAHEGKIAGSLV